MIKNKAVFFDFDGVIHNTFQFHLNGIRNYFNVDLSAENYRAMHDGNFYNAVAPKGLEHADWPAYTKSIHDEFSAFAANSDEKKYLHDLSKESKLFLVTSGSRFPVEGYLKANHILECFTDARYFEDGLSKTDKFKDLFAEYSVLPENAVFVTDTVGDVREAHEVGLRSIAVTFGYHDRARLEAVEPFRIADSWKEVADAIDDAFSAA